MDIQYGRWTTHILTHRNPRDSDEGNVCVCTEVKFYLLFSFKYLNSSSQECSSVGEGVRPLSNVDMANETSSRSSILDEHLSHRLLKQEICSGEDHLQLGLCHVRLKVHDVMAHIVSHLSATYKNIR